MKASLSKQLEILNTKKEEVDKQYETYLKQLEKISGLSKEEAKERAAIAREETKALKEQASRAEEQAKWDRIPGEIDVEVNLENFLGLMGTGDGRWGILRT